MTITSSVDVILFEVFWVFLFVICLIISLSRKNIPRLRSTIELMCAFCFGLLLENTNVFFGLYAYSSEFHVFFGRVPLVLGCFWGSLIFAATSISDSLVIPEVSRPLMDTVLVLLTDFLGDPVAIRLAEHGLWNWPVPLTVAWFGVPFDNYYGWTIVLLAFTCLVRSFRFVLWQNRIYSRFHSLKVLSYIGLVLTAIPVCTGMWFVHSFWGGYSASPIQRFLIVCSLFVWLGLLFAIFNTILPYKGNQRQKGHIIIHLVLVAPYLFFLSLLVLNIFLGFPILGIIGILTLFFHISIVLWFSDFNFIWLSIKERIDERIVELFTLSKESVLTNGSEIKK